MREGWLYLWPCSVMTTYLTPSSWKSWNQYKYAMQAPGALPKPAVQCTYSLCLQYSSLFISLTAFGRMVRRLCGSKSCACTIPQHFACVPVLPKYCSDTCTSSLLLEAWQCLASASLDATKGVMQAPCVDRKSQLWAQCRHQNNRDQCMTFCVKRRNRVGHRVSTGHLW